MFGIILTLFTIGIFVSSFMEGYDKGDTPRKVRKISRTQQNSVRLEELNREKEVSELKKELRRMQNEQDR